MPLLADPVTVLPEQREALEQLVRTHSTPQQLALRARMILHAADGVGVRESARTRCVAEDGAVLAPAVAAGCRRTIGARAADRCAAVRSSCDIHTRANLRGHCDDLREAVGQRAADQPLEPARDCRRSDATRPGAEHLA